MTTPRAILALLLLTGCATAPKPAATMQRMALAPTLYASVAPSIVWDKLTGAQEHPVCGPVEVYGAVTVTGVDTGTVIIQQAPSLTPAVWTDIATMPYVKGTTNTVCTHVDDSEPQQMFFRAKLVTQ